MYAHGFRIYFTPLPGFFSPFPHGTGSLSVDIEYLALEDGPPIFKQDFSCPALLFAHLAPHTSFHIQALPISLATTLGISVDLFSCSYLDVSVHSVRFIYPMYSDRNDLTAGFPHSDISGSKLICQLPEAFRRLSRPSSPDIAKASTICTYSLDPITLKPKPFLNLDSAVHETRVIGNSKALSNLVRFALLLKLLNLCLIFTILQSLIHL